MLNKLDILFNKIIKTVAKWSAYLFGWLLPIYVIPCANNLGATAFLKWYYVDMGLPPMTAKMFLLFWFAMMVMTCIMLALIMDGVSHTQNCGKLFPMPAVIISQFAACAIYITGALLSSYKGLFYYPTVFLSFVINEVDREIITEANEPIWLLFLTVTNMLIFVAVAMIVYMQRRKQQATLIEIQERYLREKYKS